MALSRALAPTEATRRCGCGHLIVCKPGALCPRCKAVIPDVRAIHDALVRTSLAHGSAELARIAPVLGVRGRLVTDGRRVFGVVG